MSFRLPKEAYLLVVRRAIRNDELLRELQGLEDQVDKKAVMRGRVVNKLARWNLCFDDIAQRPNIEAGEGTVVSFKDVPFIDDVRRTVSRLGGRGLLKAELNYYYDNTKCGIGYHGDSERKLVIGVRAGASMSFCYQWYQQSKPIGKKLTLTLDHGDLYVMGDKTVGYDWKKKIVPTLRHSAGCKKYTDVPA